MTRGWLKWVLVIDDDAAPRGMWIDALMPAGYKALGCGAGHEALELMRRSFPAS